MNWLGGRKATKLLCVLLVGGCVNEPRVSGKVPERDTKPAPHNSPVKTNDRANLYNQRLLEGSSNEPKVENVDAADARIGVASKHEFHLIDCPRLKDVPVADQVRFTSKWDGLDAGYRPCDDCKAAR